MVVSGVPKKTDKHACEIANMALDLVEASRSFIIPHKPDELLRIRVGLHSGESANSRGYITKPEETGGQKDACIIPDTSRPYLFHASDKAACGRMNKSGDNAQICSKLFGLTV